MRQAVSRVPIALIATLLLGCAAGLLSCATNANDPNNAEEFRDLGIDFFENGDYERAVDYLERAYRSDPTLPAVRYNLARASMKTSAPDEAIALLVLQIEEEPQNQVLVETLAAAYMLADEPDAAADILLPIRSSLGKSGSYNLLLALIRAEREGDLELVLEGLPVAWYEEDKQLAGMAGVAYDLLGQDALALDFLEAATETETPFFAWHLARILEANEEFIRAAELYKSLYEKGYRKAESTARLVQIYYLKLEDSVLGFQWLKSAIEVDSSFSSEAYTDFLTPSQLDELGAGGEEREE